MTTDEFVAAWEGLRGDLFGQIYARLRSPEESEDLLQEVFISAWKALPRYRESGGGPEHWLRVIAARRVIDHYRRHHATEGLEVVDAVDAGDLGNAFVGPAWECLSLRHQTAIYLRYIEGRSATQVAEALGVREAVLNSLLMRAKRRFKEALLAS